MKIRVGIIDSLIETDNPQIIKVLSDKWAFPVQGYQFTPAYRRRGWDGKKRLPHAKSIRDTGSAEQRHQGTRSESGGA